MAEKLDKQQIKQSFEEIRDERIPKANTARRIGNAFLSLFEFAAPNDEKLSSVYDDTAQGLITFAKGLVSKALAKLASLFVSGDSQLGENGTKTTFGDFKTDATGASISVDKDGTSTAEFDFLTIRRAAYFREITIKELKHVGGELALSAAAMTCSKVEWLNARGRVITAGTPTYYKCYFETTDGKRHIYQEFAVGDQARCQQFRIEADTTAFASTKYYWRLVTGIGDNYIILSNQDGKFDGEGVPEVGDNIVQLGFQGANNPIRTSAIILSATASDAPSTKYYQGITSFSLQDCEVKDEGFEGGQFHSRIYGTYYVGDREQTNFIAYDPLTKTATFKGKAIFEPGTTLPDGTPIEQLQGLGIKSGNLLLNSGFTGDYTSQEFDEKTEITDETTIFSDSAKYWEGKNAEFIETSESASGHAATLTDGGLAQQLTAVLVTGEKYTLSFKARGSSLRFTVGGYSETIQLTDELKRYSVIFECSDATDTRFRIFETTATVMEVTLNQGNLPIQWAAAYDDNDHALADFEAFKYLTSAITEAKTTVNGGLVMTQDIRVGQFRNGKMVQETGGMSGYAATRNSPFIWGGGDMSQAFYTIGKYINDPGYQATDEELRSMCSFVLTHGGRAILNDIILHGYIYAKGGVLQSVRSPNGNFSIDEQGNAKIKGEIEASKGTIGGFTIGNATLSGGGSSGNLTINPSFIRYKKEGLDAIWGGTWQYGIEDTAAQLVVEKNHPTQMGYAGQQGIASQHNVGLFVSAKGTMHKRSRETAIPNSVYPNGNHAIFCPNGDFAGFRPCFRIINQSQRLTKFDVFVEIYETWTAHNDVDNTDTVYSVGEVTLSLPEDPEVGQMFWIQRSTTKKSYVKTTDGSVIYTPKSHGELIENGTANELLWVWWNGDVWRMAWSIGV